MNSSDLLGERCTGISDDDIDTLAREAFAKLPKLKAIPGKFIAWIAPFRKEGVIEIPWDYQSNSCEAVMIDDASGSEIPMGSRLMVHPEKGIEHHINGEKIGFFQSDALIPFVVEP